MFNTWLPDTALAPLQLPEAAHEVAFVLDQVSVLEPSYAILAGLALRVTVGATAVTVTATLCAALPPVPLQVRV